MMDLVANAWLLPLLPLIVFVIVLASGRRLPRFVLLLVLLLVPILRGA